MAVKPYQSNIKAAAEAAHEANRILCLALGDDSQPKWEDAPEWQKNSAINGASMILDNPSTTPEQSHENWLKQKAGEGWKYGPVKNPETKEHPCFVPYAELPPQQRLKDDLFGIVVRAALQLSILILVILGTASVSAQQPPAPQAAPQVVKPKAPYDSTKAQLAVTKQENLQLKANAATTAYQDQMKQFQADWRTEENFLTGWIEEVRKANGWDATYTYDQAKDEWVHTPKVKADAVKPPVKH